VNISCDVLQITATDVHKNCSINILINIGCNVAVCTPCNPDLCTVVVYIHVLGNTLLLILPMPDDCTLFYSCVKYTGKHMLFLYKMEVKI
jgi:hypothetical protein